MPSGDRRTTGRCLLDQDRFANCTRPTSVKDIRRLHSSRSRDRPSNESEQSGPIIWPLPPPGRSLAIADGQLLAVVSGLHDTLRPLTPSAVVSDASRHPQRVLTTLCRRSPPLKSNDRFPRWSSQRAPRRRDGEWRMAGSSQNVPRTYPGLERAIFLSASSRAGCEWIHCTATISIAARRSMRFSLTQLAAISSSALDRNILSTGDAFERL